jgi:Gpi18-like mannosyltransferase
MLRPVRTSSTRGQRAATTDALGWWGLSHLALYLLVASVGYVVAIRSVRPSLIAPWHHWDALHYGWIAEQGYRLDDPEQGRAAFFPALPLLMRGLHDLGMDVTAAGLLVSLLAGAVGAVALARLAELDVRGAGGLTVLLLVVSPAAVFLAAPYSEALFLALALPAWLMARRGRWLAAGLLTAGAASVRVSGIFLAVALVVQWLTEPAGRRRAADAAALLLPAVPVLAYMVFLHAGSGDWLAWMHAQETGWDRTPTWPWHAFATSWHDAQIGSQRTEFVYIARLELLAMVAGVATTLWCALRRRWGEATYVGLSVAALGASSHYMSVHRATLLWWPLWIGLAGLVQHRPWALRVYLAVSIPVAAVLAVAFCTAHWAG